MKNKLLKLCSLSLACAVCVSSSLTVQAKFKDEGTTATWTWAKEHIAWAEENDIVSGKGENIFDADGLVTRAEAATMLVNYKGIDVEQYDVPCEQFEDVGEEWYTKYVNAAYANGIVAGKSENIFDPEGQLTRAEAATLIVNYMGYELLEEAKSSFVDIEGDWYTDYINTAYAHEIVAGKGEGVFEPSANVSRAEMVTMIHNTLNENYEVGDIEYINVSYGELGVSDFAIANALGQMLYFDAGDIEFSGELISTTDTWVAFGGGITLALQASENFAFESSAKDVPGVSFVGNNATVGISGSNIDKVRVDADGTIYLYGTNMEYMARIKNVAHELEYSASGSDDVILRVVDKQLVEVTE